MSYTTTLTGSNMDIQLSATALTVDLTKVGAQGATGPQGPAGVYLDAIAETKAVTAVDVFVYDTSKDSDGGAWRKRTQGTSWYNEALNTATRGSRKEFPAVAVIVAESTKVTIYDGDDPGLPMWMVFNATTTSHMIRSGTISSVVMVNGLLVIGMSATNRGVTRIEFNLDTANQIGDFGVYSNLQSISDRNDSSSLYALVDNTQAIVNNTINDVAMTVLPNAPIDAATGLPVPTIAVATDGGVSVLKDDGTVVDLTTAVTKPSYFVAFNDANELQYQIGDRNGLRVDDIPSTDFAIGSHVVTGNSKEFYAPSGLSDAGWSGDILFLGSSGSGDLGKTAFLDNSIRSVLGLTFIDRNPTTPAEGMVAYTTSDYNTGWMNGDIKGAWLSDTDTTALVGAELVTNGTFDTNDLTGWTDASTGTGSIDASTGAAVLTTVDGSNRAILDQSFATVVGQTYFVTFSRSSASEATSGFHIGTSLGGNQIVRYDSLGNGTQLGTFTATTTTTYIRIYGTYNAGSINFDNISVRLADADRSVNNKGLAVYGTVTKTAVATGADLVAYSGFSAANYLEQPHNSGLDFGTGDFSVMGWVEASGTGNDYLVDRRAASGALITVRRVSGILRLGVRDSGSTLTEVDGSLVSDGTWQHFAATRESGTIKLYQNGVLAASAIASGDLTNTSSTFGVGVAITSPPVQPFNGSLALLRISATAPTAEQIAKIYNDEKPLFQENAQATLYGTSDAVTALAHDDATDLLHVGTSSGRSVFQGLRRVSNTTVAVGTAISASNNLIVEE